MKKLLAVFIFLCLCIPAHASKVNAPAHPGSGTFAELDEDNEFTGTNIFENGIAFGNMFSPPPLGTQYTLFVYGGELYWRTTDDNLAAGWSIALQDPTIKFLQVSTAGADVADLTAGGDAAFDTYWSAAAPLTVARVNDKFIMSGPIETAIGSKMLKFNNDVTGPPNYTFDVADSPITFNIPANIPAVGTMGAALGESEFFGAFGTVGGFSELSFKVTRSEDGTVSSMSISVFQLGHSPAQSQYLITDLEDTFAFDTEVVLSFVVEGTGWVLYADGVSIADSTDLPSAGGEPTMVLFTAIESWTGVTIGSYFNVTDAATEVTVVKIGDLTITPTF
jgi:hypothetical protein